MSEDLDGIRKGLSQLRSNFSPQDPQQQVVDQLESHISEMMSQLMDRDRGERGERGERERERAGSPSTRRNRRHVSSCSHSGWRMGVCKV